MKINKKLIKELVDNLEEFKLSELEYAEKDIKIKVSRQTKMSQNISPEIGFKKPHMSESKVVLPDPLSPRSNTFSPLATLNSGTWISKSFLLDQ